MINLFNNNSITTAIFYAFSLAVFAFISRKLPGFIYSSAKSLFVTTLTVNTTNAANAVIMDSLISWFMKNNENKLISNYIIEATPEDRHLSRQMRLNDPLSGEFNLTPGIGIHFFIYKKKTICWIQRNSGKNSVSTVSGNEITLNLLTKNKDIIKDFLSSVNVERDLNDIDIYTKGSRGEWKLSRSKPKRKIESVIIDSDIKEKMVKDIKYFYENKRWYTEKGLPYKLTYLLHGEPGTGKSSFIFSLASYFDSDIYMFNLSDLTNTDFETMISTIPSNVIIVMEDFELSSNTETQEQKDTSPSKVKNLSLSTILNNLDGISSINENLVFITTNHVEQMDASLVRKGRVDHIVEIGYLKDKQIKEYINLVYPGIVIDNTTTYEPMSGCDLQSLYLEHKDDSNSFLKFLKVSNSQTCQQQ